MKYYTKEALRQTLVGQYEILVGNISFEERSVMIPQILSSDKNIRAIYFQNEGFADLPSTSARREEISSIFGSRLIIQNTSVDDPILTLRVYKETLGGIENIEEANIIVDITTFTHEGLLLMFRLLKSNFSNGKHTYVYNVAKDYSVQEPTKSKWLSKGTKEIRTVIGYSGRIGSNKNRHLVILAGFELQRAIVLIESIEPKKISIGFGDVGSLGEVKNYHTGKHFRNLLEKASAIYENVEEFTFSCDDPAATRISINRIVERNKDDNIIVAPMNTKIAAIGAALSAGDYRDIQIIYVAPRLYNIHGYSTPDDRFYQMDNLY